MLNNEKIRKIDSYYGFKLKHNKLFVFNKKNPDKQTAIANRPIFFTFGRDFQNEPKEIIQKAVDDGSIIKATPEDIYSVFTDLSDDDIYYAINNISKKCQDYLNKYKNKIGLIKISYTDENYLENNHLYKYIGELQENPMSKSYDIYEGNNTYVLVHMWTNGIDDYGFVSYYFNSEPDYSSIIQELDAIQYIDNFFRFNKEAEFVCHTCGKTASFFDLSGSLQQKVQKVKNNTCCD